MGLDVSMNHRRRLFVQVFKRTEQLVSPVHHETDRKRAASIFQHFAQVVTRDELHHEEPAITFWEVIYDFG